MKLVIMKKVHVFKDTTYVHIRDVVVIRYNELVCKKFSTCKYAYVFANNMFICSSWRSGVIK